MTYVIGIDGGGTKTEVVLADYKGHIIWNNTYGTTNPNAINKQQLMETFQKVFLDIEEKVPGSIKGTRSVFAGISGAGSEPSRVLVEEAISKHVFRGTKVSVVVDTINALYSGTFGKPGIVQICGTGSITYGINKENKQDRVGGWGYLLGDEGSGYDLGKKGITAALHSLDGRGRETVILPLLYEHYKVNHARDLIDKIYHSTSPRMEIASLARLIFKAYELGDIVAINIMKIVVEDVSNSIQTLHSKLFKTNEKIDVVLCGGLFSNSHLLPVLLEDNLRDEPFTFVIPKVPPVVGSIIGAYMDCDKQVTPQLMDNLTSNWK